MSDTAALMLVGIIAISAALLAWFVIDMGTITLARYQASFTERTQFQAQEFFLFIDPRKLFIANLAIMSLGATVVWVVTGTALITLPALFILAGLPRLVYARLKKRRLARFEQQLPDALMMLSGALRAGLGMNSAITQLVAEAQPPLAQEFGLFLREQRLGVTFEQSLSNLGRRVNTPSSVLIVSAMRIANETGGGLAETLERTAQTLRARLQMEGKIGALTAQGKLQAWVVGGLPLLLMAILNKMEPEAMSHLWHTRPGWATLIVVAALEVLGIYVIRRIVDIDV
jgi:tight adherence protein B